MKLKRFEFEGLTQSLKRYLVNAVNSNNIELITLFKCTNATTLSYLCVYLDKKNKELCVYISTIISLPPLTIIENIRISFFDDLEYAQY